MKKFSPEKLARFSRYIEPWLIAEKIIPVDHFVRRVTIETARRKLARPITKKRRLSPKQLDALLAQPLDFGRSLAVQTMKAVVNARFITLGDLARELQRHPLCLKAKGLGQDSTRKIVNILLSKGVPLDQELLIGPLERRAILQSSFYGLTFRAGIYGSFRPGTDRLRLHWKKIADFVADDKRSTARRIIGKINPGVAEEWLTALREKLNQILAKS